MLIDQEKIRNLIPHAGNMCLLSGVTQFNETHIMCTAESHLDPCNPLAHNGKIRTLNGIEFAAQAMAVHGGLTGLVDKRPRAGLLVSVRDVVAHTEYLSDSAETLHIEAEQMMAENNSVCYNFRLHTRDKELLRGRATVILDYEGAFS